MSSIRMQKMGGAGCTAQHAARFCGTALLVLCAAAFGADPFIRGPARTEVSVDALSVVKVRSQIGRNARSSATLGTQREGTGIVIDSSGLVLTVGYLITESEKVELSTADGKVFPATVIGHDSTTGMGLLKALTPLPLKPIDFGESSAVAERDLVLIVGFDGIAPAYVVSKRQFVGYWEYLLDEAIYTAPATVNWQGAALLNREGQLLGIGSLVVGDALGTQANIPGNMFIPIDVVKPVLGDIIANGKTTTKPRPWIGVNTQEIQGNLIVMRVSPEGPAEDAGLQKGDIIIGLGGKPVQGQADFYTKLWATGGAGVDIALDVLKGNQVQKYTLKSRDRNSYFRPHPVF